MFDRAGKLIGERQNNNKIVSSGRELVARLFEGLSGASPISHFSIGTGSSSTSDTATGLEQIQIISGTDDQKNVNITGVSLISGTNQWKVDVHGVLTMGEANNLAITEVGLFSMTPYLAMYNRVVFAPINKTSAFELQFFWEIIF